MRFFYGGHRSGSALGREGRQLADDFPVAQPGKHEIAVMDFDFAMNDQEHRRAGIALVEENLAGQKPPFFGDDGGRRWWVRFGEKWCLEWGK